MNSGAADGVRPIIVRHFHLHHAITFRAAGVGRGKGNFAKSGPADIGRRQTSDFVDLLTFRVKISAMNG